MVGDMETSSSMLDRVDPEPLDFRKMILHFLETCTNGPSIPPPLPAFRKARYGGKEGHLLIAPWERG